MNYQEASDNGLYDKQTQTITWKIGDLKIGQSKTVTFTVKLPSVMEYTLWENGAQTHYDNNPNNPETGDPVDIPSNKVEVETDAPKVVLEKNTNSTRRPAQRIALWQSARYCHLLFESDQ